jgi:hypothetical protein
MRCRRLRPVRRVGARLGVTSSTLIDTQRENQRDNDTDRYELTGSIQASSQGRPNEKPGIEAHRANRPTRLRSPKKAPVPDHPTLGREPDGTSAQHFHAARSGTENQSAPTGDNAEASVATYRVPRSFRSNRALGILPDVRFPLTESAWGACSSRCLERAPSELPAEQNWWASGLRYRRSSNRASVGLYADNGTLRRPHQMRPQLGDSGGGHTRCGLSLVTQVAVGLRRIANRGAPHSGQ